MFSCIGELKNWKTLKIKSIKKLIILILLLKEKSIILIKMKHKNFKITHKNQINRKI